MATLHNTIDINQPAEHVFWYCSDLCNEVDWNPDITFVERVTDGPVGLGTRYRAQWAQGGPMIVEYVQFEPPVHWACTATSDRLTINFHASVAPIPDGTRLAVRMELVPHGITRLALPILRRVMQRAEERNVVAIKARLESNGTREARS